MPWNLRVPSFHFSYFFPPPFHFFFYVLFSASSKSLTLVQQARKYSCSNACWALADFIAGQIGPMWPTPPLCRTGLIKWHRSERAPGCGSRPRPVPGQTQPLIKTVGKKKKKRIPQPSDSKFKIMAWKITSLCFVFTRTNVDRCGIAWKHVMIKTQTGCLCVISKTNFAFSCISLLPFKTTYTESVRERSFEVQTPTRDKKASALNQHLQSICIAQLSQSARRLRSATGPLQHIRDAWRGFSSVSVVRSQAWLSLLSSVAEWACVH